MNGIYNSNNKKALSARLRKIKNAPDRRVKLEDTCFTTNIWSILFLKKKLTIPAYLIQ
jgi:hypothetical protein